MQKTMLLKTGIFFLALLTAVENSLAQTEKNANGYAEFSFEELQGATLADLAPEAVNGITSYSVTIACERKGLYDLACTGDTLNSAFHTYLTKTDAKSCLCYFDKIMAGAEPRKGFVIKVVK